MPNGKTHSILTIATSATIFCVTVYLKSDIQTSLYLTGGTLAGLILHPDLDQAENRKGLWYKIWWPYGKMIKHRDEWSHFPVVSTAIRLIYILGMPVSILWWYYPIEYWGLTKMMPYAIIGLMMADTVHFLADIITTKIKRIF